MAAPIASPHLDVIKEMDSVYCLTPLKTVSHAIYKRKSPFMIRLKQQRPFQRWYFTIDMYSFNDIYSKTLVMSDQ